MTPPSPALAVPPSRPTPLSVPYPFLFPAVGGEVINGDLHALALLQLLQGGDDEVKVEGIGVVKVEVIAGCLLLLLLGQHLPPEKGLVHVAIPTGGLPSPPLCPATSPPAPRTT